MLSIGDILDGKYQVVKTLGQGGMSTVYLCKNIRLENLWAIKEVKKELNGQIDLLAEPNILKNLSHPGIPRVVDIFYREDNLYIVEDYIEGETLQDYIEKRGFIGDKEINRIVLSICDIIKYLHSFTPTIIYRDLKPSNVMITPKGKVVLIDFGISRVYKQDGDKDTIYMGSKGYAAPEQYGTEQTCIQTDIYGIGAVMYFMTMGKAPASLLGPLKDKSYSNEVNTKLKKIIQKAMQIDIKSRYSSVDELRKELIRFSEKEYDTKTLLIKKTEECSIKMSYNKPKVNVDISKKSFKKKFVFTLVCFAIILGLVYFATDDVTTKQIINSTQTTNSKNEDKAVNDISKSENKNDINSIDNKSDINGTDNKSDTNITNNNKADVKSSTQSTENKADTKNPSTNENTSDKEVSNVSDKSLQNKKESKTKSNSKGKGKHKYDEGY